MLQGSREFANIHKVLVKCLQESLSQTEENGKEIRDTLKCLRYIFQLMTASRNVFISMSGGGNVVNDQFSECIIEVSTPMY